MNLRRHEQHQEEKSGRAKGHLDREKALGCGWSLLLAHVTSELDKKWQKGRTAPTNLSQISRTFWLPTLHYRSVAAAAFKAFSIGRAPIAEENITESLSLSYQWCQTVQQITLDWSMGIIRVRIARCRPYLTVPINTSFSNLISEYQKTMLNSRSRVAIK